MKDHFALLKQVRRPWLDPNELKQAFLNAASECHPDRAHNAPDDIRQSAHDAYTALNEAHQCLQQPHTRLRHLLELESGQRFSDLQEMPPDLMDLFTAIHRVCREVDDFLAERARTTSPMLQVALLERGERVGDEVGQLKTTLESKLQELETALQTLDDQWTSAQNSGSAAQLGTLLPQIESLCRLFSFHQRWTGQVQSRLLQLLP